MTVKPFRAKRYSRDRNASTEILVGFRMDRARYAVLKTIAARAGRPIAAVINEVLDQKLRLGERAAKAEKTL